MKIKPFDALRPRPDLAPRVAAVPYDVVDTAEAKALAEGNPCSLLRISRPEIELPAGTDIHSDAVYDRALANFRRFQADGILVRDGRESLYVYRQVMGAHAQCGIVACCHIDDYAGNVIRKHEKTRKDKEDDRTRHTKTLSANTGPVFLTYRDNRDIDAIVAATVKTAPVYDFTAPDGIRHTVWRVSETRGVVDLFASVPVCYIADGHHRAAAAARAGAERRAENKGHTGSEEYNWFLAVLFPATQLQIMPYNRLVLDLNGRTAAQVLAEAAKVFTVKADAGPKPERPRQIRMYLGGKWYGLEYAADPKADPVASLDVSYLQDKLLAPVLGIADPRTDKRIEFSGGIRGTQELADRVDSGKAAIAFSMYPVTVDQVMAIADADQIMAPKSTWFEPKLRSGLLIHTF